VWLLVSGRDRALVGSLVAALLAEQKTVELDDELLRFVPRESSARLLDLPGLPAIAALSGATTNVFTEQNWVVGEGKVLWRVGG
jgi:hypothetical protein